MHGIMNKCPPSVGLISITPSEHSHLQLTVFLIQTAACSYLLRLSLPQELILLLSALFNLSIIMQSNTNPYYI